MQRQLLLDSQVPTLVTCHLTTNTRQEKAMKSHLLEYLDQHRRLEESVTPKKNEKSDVKSRLQVITVIITFLRKVIFKNIENLNINVDHKIKIHPNKIKLWFL